MNEHDECMHLVFHSRNPVETTVNRNRAIKRKCIIASKTRGQCTLIGYLKKKNDIKIEKWKIKNENCGWHSLWKCLKIYNLLFVFITNQNNNNNKRLVSITQRGSVCECVPVFVFNDDNELEASIKDNKRKS